MNSPMNSPITIISLYTDGSIVDNKKSTLGGIFGGSGVYIVNSKTLETTSLQRKIPNSTNNISELTAILMAVEYIEESESNEFEYVIYTDSMYSLNAVTKWYKGWKKNGWITSKKEAVKNKELIELISGKIEKLPRLRLEHVKGHCGNPGNEMADELAKKACFIE